MESIHSSLVIGHPQRGANTNFYALHSISRAHVSAAIRPWLGEVDTVSDFCVNSPCNSPCAASLAGIPPGGLGLSGLVHEEAHPSISTGKSL